MAIAVAEIMRSVGRIYAATCSPGNHRMRRNVIDAAKKAETAMMTEFACVVSREPHESVPQSKVAGAITIINKPINSCAGRES